MHALCITFTVSANPEEFREPNRQFARALAGGCIPGFVSKTWLSAGTTQGGFCVFRDRSAAEQYLTEMVHPAVAGNPAFTNLRVEHFEVNEELSALTNGPVARSAVA